MWPAVISMPAAAVGAIGGSGSQDDVISQAGVAALK
jgi:hypothetical protein